VTVTDYLSIELADEPQQATWAAFDAAGHLLTGIMRGSIAAAAAAAHGRRVIVLVPAVDVITAQAALPAASQTRLRQLVPYSLEESLADDVEELSFAIGPRLPSGGVSVAVVAKQRIERWLAELGVAGITPHAVFAASEGVPDTPGALTLILSGARIYGRRPGGSPFALEGLTLPEALDVVRGTDEHATDLEHLFVYADDAATTLRRGELLGVRERVATLDVKRLPDGAFAHLAAGLVARPGTNLLQGAYAPKSNWAALARPWRTAAALIVAFGALALVGQGIEYYALAREDAALTQLLTAECQRVAAASRLSVCETEIQRRLGALARSGAGERESFLSTLAAIADARGGDSRIEALSYRNRVMDLQLMASNVSALDEFVRGLAETQRFDAAIQSSNPDPNGVQGRIQVEGAQ